MGTIYQATQLTCGASIFMSPRLRLAAGHAQHTHGFALKLAAVAPHSGRPHKHAAAAGGMPAMRGSFAQGLPAPPALSSAAFPTTCTTTRVASAGSSTSRIRPTRSPQARSFLLLCAPRRERSNPGQSQGAFGRGLCPKIFHGSQGFLHHAQRKSGQQRDSPAGTNDSAVATAHASARVVNCGTRLGYSLHTPVGLVPLGSGRNRAYLY
mmetsp:Transcript_1203/g.2775  ORF Transcript_1203/g.2775 Transcript_1203/m.2775 type:complete len:209 (+) Transcript_1203:169-795(+)